MVKIQHDVISWPQSYCSYVQMDCLNLGYFCTLHNNYLFHKYISLGNKDECFKSNVARSYTSWCLP